MAEGQINGMLYFKQCGGILKIIELVFNLIGFLCIVTAFPSPRGDAFLAASASAFIITSILLVCYVGYVVVNTAIPWFKIEFIYCVIWSVFYLIVSSLCVDISSYNPYVAGGSFGLFATVTYIIDAVHKFGLCNW